MRVNRAPRASVRRTGVAERDEPLDAVGQLLEVVVRLEQALSLGRGRDALVAPEEPVEDVVDERLRRPDECRRSDLVVRVTSLPLELHGRWYPVGVLAQRMSRVA